MSKSFKCVKNCQNMSKLYENHGFIPRLNPKSSTTNKETIWHFSCSECNGFWSIAVMDKWLPHKLYCPHCGNREDHSNKEYSESRRYL